MTVTSTSDPAAAVAREVEGLPASRPPAQDRPGRCGSALRRAPPGRCRRARRSGRPRGAGCGPPSRSIRSRRTSSGTWSGMRAASVPAAGRVDERERMVEADEVDQREGVGEVGLGLAREPDDDVGRERDVGHRLADALDQRQVALARVGAPHRLQDPRRSRLHRQVELLAHRVALGHGLDHVGAHVLGVRAREPDAVDAVHGVERSQEGREAGLDRRPQVAAVRVHVLAEQRELADAVGRRAGRPRARGRRVGGCARARAPTARCSTSSCSCIRSRSASMPGTRGRASAAARPRTCRTSRSGRAASLRRPGCSHPGGGCSRGRTPGRRRETGRRARPSSTPTSSRRRRSPCRGRGAWRRVRPSGARRGDRRPSRGSCRC